MSGEFSGVWIGGYGVYALGFRNEEQIGAALKQSGIPREELYITGKVSTDPPTIVIHILKFTVCLVLLSQFIVISWYPY